MLFSEPQFVTRVSPVIHLPQRAWWFPWAWLKQQELAQAHSSNTTPPGPGLAPDCYSALPWLSFTTLPPPISQSHQELPDPYRVSRQVCFDIEQTKHGNFSNPKQPLCHWKRQILGFKGYSFLHTFYFFCLHIRRLMFQIILSKSQARMDFPPQKL